jgi:ATP phosphoribosyltransferase
MQLKSIDETIEKTREYIGTRKTKFQQDMQTNILNKVVKDYVNNRLSYYDYDRASKRYEKIGELIPNAHQWCYQQTIWHLDKLYSVIVSNTFTRKWEYQEYIDYCKEHNIPYEVITCTGNYQNVHGVPQETIEKMRQRWED